MRTSIYPCYIDLISSLQYGRRLLFSFRARICKSLWSPGIDSEESISPAHVAWRASTTNRVFVPARQAGNRYLGSLRGIQIRAQFFAFLCLILLPFWARHFIERLFRVRSPNLALLARFQKVAQTADFGAVDPASLRPVAELMIPLWGEIYLNGSN